MGNETTNNKAMSYPWAVEKHLNALGKKYEKCARCPGTTGKLDSAGNALCANVDGRPVSVTVLQVSQCDGKKPPPFNQEKQKPHHKPHPIFRRPERRL